MKPMLLLALVLLAGCAVGGSGIAICPAPRQSSCEAKMEMAMRAMEPFIPHANDTYNDTYMEQKAFKSGEMFEAALSASKQWEAVKRECWRER